MYSPPMIMICCIIFYVLFFLLLYNNLNDQPMLSAKHIAKINERDSRLRQRDFLFFIYMVG